MNAIADARIVLTLAGASDVSALYALRHNVYATELGQYAPRADGLLPDAPDIHSRYLTASVGGKLIGFIGITPPTSPRYSLDHHMPREALPFARDHQLYEMRALTVATAWRGSLAAAALLYAGFRWVEAHGGTRLLALGRRDVLDLYLRVGFSRVGTRCQVGAVTYELVTATIDEIAARLPAFRALTQRLQDHVDWRLHVPQRRPSPCYHGGAFFAAIGDTFDDLTRRERVISADVLDAWFPPAPAVRPVLEDQWDWIMRTSPPNHAEGLVRVIARVRGLDPNCILPGGGSSPLIFLALQRWLTAQSRVLILDPTYGEYAHLLEQVIGCRVDRFRLARADGYRIDLRRLARKLRDAYDLFVWVNPNNPTGRYVSKPGVAAVLRDLPPATRVWIDETYVDYAGPGASLESLAARSENVVVCKSLSKAYALSGLRAGYLCGAPHQLEDLRARMPPWSVSLPAQIAATHALLSPAYYARRYRETRVLRAALVQALARLGIREFVPGVANFILLHLPDAGPNTATVVARCRAEGLFLRDVSGMGTALGPRALRIAVKDAETNARMLPILARVLPAAPPPATFPRRPRATRHPAGT